MKKKIIAGISALTITISAIGLVNMGTVEVSAFDGDFESGTYDVWDGSTYDFSWYGDGTATSYTISSAAQLAALSIVTNDLTGEDYEAFVATLPSDIPEQYIGLVDDFSDKTITLAADIDLRDYDWLPIAYPWDTPNVTNRDYDALGHVPKDLTAVDSWVGDENGDMINTRYLEYPESEMRFRDLITPLAMYSDYYWEDNVPTVSSEAHYQKDVDYIRQENSIVDIAEKVKGTIYPCISNLSAVSTVRNKYPVDVIRDYMHDGSPEGLISDNLPWSSSYGAINYLYTYNTGVNVLFNGHYYVAVHRDIQKGKFPTNIVKGREIHSTDILYSYTYADIESYADNNGFNGTFDGNNYRIKGLHPKTPWTEDTLERLTTYDPIGKGLFSYLGVNGVIENLNIKGEYTDADVVSYSSFLCAYNYGTIDNCYVYGEMEQGLVTQIYPIRRDYGPNGTSTYELSAVAGTVLPVGNSGFVTAVNNGIISNCTTKGAVTQAYRQFGFMACINKGSIEKSSNGACFFTTQVETDFITDEWSYFYKLEDTFDIENAAYAEVGNYKNMHSDTIDAFYANYPNVERNDETNVRDWYFTQESGFTITHNDPLQYIAAFMQGSATDGKPWVPGLYNTAEGESVAANHLYGVYGYTAVGGICAVNSGDVVECKNEGNIEVMHNTSTRNSGFLYGQGDGVARKDYLSYIRPNNAYGLFSTQAETMNIAAGIAALNTGRITECMNSGDITKRELTYRDRVATIGGTYGRITYTENGFYANDCVIYENTDKMAYNPMGLRWWIESDDDVMDYTPYRGGYHSDGNSWSDDIGTVVPADPNIGKVYHTLPYLANMPYPIYEKAFNESVDKFVYKESKNIVTDFATYLITSGICANNMGDIETVTNTGEAYSGIVYVSDGCDDSCLIREATQEGSTTYNIAYYLRNTNVSDCYVTNTDGAYGIAYIALNKDKPMLNDNISIYAGAGAYYRIFGDVDNYLAINDIYLYDTDSNGFGISDKSFYTDFSNTYNFQPSNNGVSWIYSCNIEDAYMFAPAERNGIGEGTVASNLTNLNFYGSSAGYALGDFKNGTYTDLHVNTIQSDDTLGLCNHILKAELADIKDLLAFTDTDSEILTIINCQGNNINVYGNTPEFNSDAGYRYYFEDSKVSDMILQTDINIEWKNPNNSVAVQVIPGVLKTLGDTNEFIDCVIQTPNGAVSYPTFNYQLDTDKTIMSDATLAYDPNARESGALAYYMDNGNSTNRTYNYTVATSDTEDILAEIEEEIELDKVFTDRMRNYPSYTRKKVAVNEHSFYKLSIPFVSNGAGEVVGVLTRDGITYTTAAHNRIFPVTDLYMITGETATLSVNEQPGYGMVSWKLITDDEETDLGYIRGATASITMDTDDIMIMSEWSDLYDISIETNPNVLITTSAQKSAKGQIVYVDTMLQKEKYEISKIWYYPYKYDSSNRPVLDTSFKYEIDKSTMSFEMPAYSVRLFVSVVGTDVEVTKAIFNGFEGEIDNDTHTIEIVLDKSVDLTQARLDVFDVTGAISITPAITEYQDFTKPVVYTVEAENGTKLNYTITIRSAADGTISYFDILGKVATIDQTSRLISISLTSDIDLTNVKPKIVWSGIAITPEGYIDLSGGTYTYAVTDSLGNIVYYTVNVETPSNSEELQEFNIAISDLDTLVWSIDEDKHIITASVPYGTPLYDCTIETLKWYGMSVNMLEGEKINLTKCNYLVIKADNGDVKSYAIIAKEIPSDVKTINQFTLYGCTGVIDEELKTITVTVPAKYDITNVKPDVVGYTAKEVADAYVARDFTNTVDYTVTAYDGSVVTYTVTVIQN